MSRKAQADHRPKQLVRTAEALQTAPDLCPMALALFSPLLSYPQGVVEEMRLAADRAQQDFEAVRDAEFPEYRALAQTFEDQAVVLVEAGEALCVLPHPQGYSEDVHTLTRGCCELILQRQTPYLFDVMDWIVDGTCSPEHLQKVEADLRSHSIYGAITLILYNGSRRDRESLLGCARALCEMEWPAPKDREVWSTPLTFLAHQAFFDLPPEKVMERPTECTVVLGSWLSGFHLEHPEGGSPIEAEDHESLERVTDYLELAWLAYKRIWNENGFRGLTPQKLRETVKSKEGQARVWHALEAIHEVDLPQHLLTLGEALLGDAAPERWTQEIRPLLEAWQAETGHLLTQWVVDQMVERELTAQECAHLREVGLETAEAIWADARERWPTLSKKQQTHLAGGLDRAVSRPWVVQAA